MTLQMRSGTPKCSKVIRRKIVTVRQHGIEDRAAMALRHNKAIAVRPTRILWVVPHQVIVQSNEQVRRAEASANMSGVGPINHRDDLTADFTGLALKKIEVRRAHRIAL